MVVQCPKHKENLRIEHSKLTILQQNYPVVLGHCPLCTSIYISRMLLSSDGKIIIEGKTYEYLHALNIAVKNEDAVQRKQKALLDAENRAIAARERIEQAKIEAERIRAEKIKAWDEAERKKAEHRQEQKRKAEIEKKRKQAELEEAWKKVLEEERKAVAEWKKTHKTSQVDTRKKTAPPHTYRIKQIRYTEAELASCFHHNHPLTFVKKARFELNNHQLYLDGQYCEQCKSIYLPTSAKQEIDKWFDDISNKEKKKTKFSKISIKQENKEKLSNKKSSNGITERWLTEKEVSQASTVNFCTNQETLFICKGLIFCKRHNHSVESTTGIILDRNEKPIKINSNYCSHCKKYFISYDEYMYYRNLYGIILGNFKITKNLTTTASYDLAEESPLHLCTYTVNQKDNLSADERHIILRYIIDSKILSKPEVIAYLQSFVRLNSRKQNMQEAVRRWTEDMIWVRNYQIDRQRHYNIANIKINR